MVLGSPKIPLPITLFNTSAVSAHRPIARTSSGLGVAGVTGVIAF
jgi:hypothetical protein